MPTYTEVLEGQIARLDSDGYLATRAWVVSGITAGTSLVKVLDDGIDATDLPAYGALHPDSGGTPADIQEIFLQEYDTSWINDENTIAKVTAVYKRYDTGSQEPSELVDEAIVQVGSTVSTTKTQKDVLGNEIIVTLTGQTDQLAEVEYEAPQTVLFYQRRESSSPVSKSRTYVGKVNSVALGSGTYAAGTLLCLGIEGESIDNGLTWQVSYRFQYNPDGWNDVLVVYIDPNTDRPHEDVDLDVASTGWVEVDLYSTADFNNLNLNFT